VIQTAPPLIARAIFQTVDPAMADSWLADARSDLLHPVVIWRWSADQSIWQRMSPVIELRLARRWVRSWSKDGSAFSITPCHRLSRSVTLPLS
jgi:hypothetical protein